MSLEAELADLMTDTVTFKPLTGTSFYGTETHSAGTSSKCRLEWSVTKTTDLQGKEIYVGGMLYMPETPVVTVKHNVLLPDGTEKRIVKVQMFSDERGPHHQEVYFDA